MNKSSIIALCFAFLAAVVLHPSNLLADNPISAAPIANVEYVHNYICQATGGTVSNGVCDTTNNSGISIAIADQSQKNWAANVEYLLAAIDKLNDLSAGSQSTSFRNGGSVTRYAVNTSSVWDAVSRFFNCKLGGYYKDGNISSADGTGAVSCKVCESGDYCPANDNERHLCSELPIYPGDPEADYYYSNDSYDENTDCYYKASNNTSAVGCQSLTGLLMRYDASISSYPQVAYEATAMPGYYIVNDGTKNAKCEPCPNGTYNSTGDATSCKNCSSLLGVSENGGTYSSVFPYNIATTCEYTISNKTKPEGCATISSSTVRYSGSSWPANTFTVTANGGHVISGSGTKTPACPECIAGTYSVGGSATQCTDCPANNYCLAGVSAPTACSTIETADGSPAGSYKTYTTKAPKPYYCYPSIFETDYANGIYSFHRGFDEAYTTYNGSTTYEGDNAGNDVNGDYYWNYFDPLNSGQNYRLTQNGIYPLYWVQAMCSSTAGGPKNPLNPFNANSSPSYSSTGGYCWCRLRRRSNLQVGTYWVTLGANFTNCGRACANHCVGLTDHAEFKTLAFTGF